jgi:hypothetical protein
MKFMQRVAIANIQKDYPKAKANLKRPGGLAGRCGSFADDLKQVLLGDYASLSEKERSEISEAEWKKLRKKVWTDSYKPTFIPDLYEIDEQQKIITLFEVEDANPLGDKKLQEMILWADDLGNEYDVRLIVTDRYGLNHRELHLEWLYTAALLDDWVHSEKRTAQLNALSAKKKTRKRDSSTSLTLKAEPLPPQA